MNDFDELERRLAARVTAPDPALRGRVLGALEREARGTRTVLALRAAAALIAVGVMVVGGRSEPRGERGGRSFRALLAAGVDLRLVTPVAPPIGPGGEVR